MSSRVRHPIFARIYARVSDAAEAKGAAAHRDELLARLRGRVVEVGAGNGRLSTQAAPKILGAARAPGGGSAGASGPPQR